MPRSGGDSDKLGNNYEAVWTVEAVLDLFEGSFKSITIEACGDESIGVEFHLENLDNSLQFHSVKRQKQGGDWSIADLCRADDGTGRSILGDLFDKVRKYAGAQVRFVSSTGANELRELCERAIPPTTVDEFRKTLNANLRSKFDQRILSLCDNNEAFAFCALKALEVIPRGHGELTRAVERRIDRLFYHMDRSMLRSDDVRRMLAEFVLANLGQRIAADRIWSLLEERQIGVRDWKLDALANDAVEAANARYVSVTQTELINSAQIVRQVSQDILNALSRPTSRGALLVAPGGFGKSCVLAQCLSDLSRDGTPFLCLRMDSFEPCITPRQLGEQLDLPASPAVVLAGIADNAPCVLVVDQLDAMSRVSGRNSRMWEVFSELCEEVRSYPHMKMLLACRDFDLKHDYRLRTLGDKKSGLVKHTLGKLSEADIRASLDSAGHAHFKPDRRQLEILGIPFHLLLFLQGDPKRTFTSVGDLYERYWERKRQNVHTYLGRSPHWNQVIEALTTKMSEQQVLFAPKAVVDDWEDDARAMASEHVLLDVQNGSQYRFFHESFFDYAYARRFCATGRRVVDLLESAEQHLFRRAQVRQMLAYRRENDFRQYINDLREIFESASIRFHIKCMAASGLARIDDPRRDEWLVAEPYLLSGDLSRYVSAALRDHPRWFDLLDSLHIFETWLSSDDTRLNNAAIWFLEPMGLQDSRSSRIAELIAPYAERNDGEWRQRILRIMSWGTAHKSKEMAAIYLGLVARGAYDDYKSEVSGSDFWGQLYNAAEESPKFFIDVLGTWFDRAVMQLDDGESWNILDTFSQNRSPTGATLVGNAATADPDYFVDQMLPRALAAILKTEDFRGGETLNRVWPWLSNHGEPFSISDAVLLFLRKSLQHLAKLDVQTFRRHASTIVTHPHKTFGYLLLRAWADNPEEFANECAEYLIADQRRFNIGYGSWSGDDEGIGESAISRIALRAISPHCSAELFEQMERRIIGYCDEYEKQTPGQRGFAELLVLRSLERSRMSQKAALRIEELERKFPNLRDAIPEEDHAGMASIIGSPIPRSAAEIMTDDQWIAAMRKYKGTTDRFRGGPVELSRSLAELARKSRARFAALVNRMPDEVDAMYFSAILDGLCSRYASQSKEEKEADDKEIRSTPTELFLSVVERLHSLPTRPCGSAISGCISRLSDRELPAHVLGVVSHYAINDPDPKADIWADTRDGKNYYGGDPHLHGVNSVRGQAAEAVSSLLYDDNTRVDGLRTALGALAQDPIVSVRTCAIAAFLPLLNISRDTAVELFLKTCEGSEAICATNPFERFVHFAIYSHYDQIRDLLQFALACDNTNAATNAARQIIVAELDGVDVGSDASAVRSGTETMRKAAAEVYARNISHSLLGNKCAEHLEGFFGDEAIAVRQMVSSSFFQMPGERLLKLEGMIGRFVESRCFESETDRFLRALEQSKVELPHIICRAAERILDFIGEEGAHIAHRGAAIAIEISTLVIRQYEQTTNETVKRRCLDLIDRMERVGYLGIGDELNRIDR